MKIFLKLSSIFWISMMVLIINIYKILSQQNHISVKAVCSNGPTVL